jgi:hypothetical protein
MPNSFVSFDYPGATFTSLNGTNNQGVVCGRYDDGSGSLYELIGRIR